MKTFFRFLFALIVSVGYAAQVAVKYDTVTGNVTEPNNLKIGTGFTLTISSGGTFTVASGSSFTVPASSIPWASVNKTGSSLADLTTRSAGDLSSGTLPLVRLVGITTSQLSATAGILNAQLANSSITVGSTVISLGATSTTLTGLTSVTSTTFAGALVGNASTATNVAASGITGTTLASNVVTSSLTTVGTLTSLTSSGTLSGLNLILTGTTGSGYIDLVSQVDPSAPTSGHIRIFDNSSNKFSWIGASGWVRNFDGTLSGSRVYTLPDANSSLPVYGFTITYVGPTTARTVTYPDFNFSVARIDASQVFTGTQTFGAIDATSIGATTRGTALFTTLAANSTVTFSAQNTANGLLHTDGSGVVTTTLTPAGLTSLGVNGVTSAAANNLTLGTASFGTALTFTSATGAATFAGVLNTNGATASSTYGANTFGGAGVSITADTSAKLQIGRYSSGAPFSYIKPGSTSSGIKISSADDSADLFIFNNGTTSTASLIINSSLAASSYTTGALQVVGGISTQAAFYAAGVASIGGNLTVGGTLFLPSSGNIQQNNGSSISGTGALRLTSNQVGIGWRNVSNSSNITISTDGSDNILFNNGTAIGYFSTTGLIMQTGVVDTSTSTDLVLKRAGTTGITVGSGLVTFATSILGSGGSAPTNSTSGSNQFTAGLATNGPLYTGGTGNFAGVLNVTATGISTFVGNIKLTGNGAGTGLFQAQNGSTDATIKGGAFGTGHYTNAQAVVIGMTVTSLSTTNIVTVGGGSSLYNAVTSIDFYTAATNTTVTGTRVGGFSSSGNFDLTGSLTVSSTSTSSFAGAVSATSSVAGTQPLVITNTAASTAPLIGSFLAANSTAGAGNGPYMTLGTAASTNNALTLRFIYVSANSASNYALLSLYGASSGITIDGNGVIASTSTVSGTNTTTAALLAKSAGFTENVFVGGTGTFAGKLSTTDVTDATTGGAGSLTTSGGIYSTLKIISNSEIVAGKPIQPKSYTVATLPSGLTTNYAVSFVTDATLTAIAGLGLAPVGGGANKTPVYTTDGGTTWLQL